MLGVEPADVDVSVPGDAIAAAETASSEISSRLIILDPERGHARLAVHSGEESQFVDITSHSEGIERDLRERDFSINAMAVPIEAWLDGGDVRHGLVDPTEGEKDLGARLVRITSESALESDPVRLVRGARFASQLGFGIEPGTAKACRGMVSKVGNSSPERVREELYALFATPGAGRGARLLDELGLLDVLIPEMAEGRGVEQPPNHHYYDVFQHGLRTVSKVDVVVDSAEGQIPDPRLAGIAPPGYPELSSHLDGVVGDGQSHRTLLRLTALLHDVGKPRCKSFDEHGRMRFFEHGEVGAAMAAEILGRLRCSRRVISHVSTMIRHHLRPSQVSSPGKAPTSRALVRFFRDLDDAAEDVVYLNMADYIAARGPLLSAVDWREYSTHCGVILSGGLEVPAHSRPFLLLDGTEVMAEFGLQPGPEVGRLLKALKAAEADGTVQTRQDALEFLRRHV